MSFDPPTLFRISNLLALTGWLLLAIALVRRRRAPVWSRWVVPGLFAAGYAAIVAVQLPTSGVDFGSLRAVQALFMQPWWLLAGWLHYLAFDLWVGAWQVDTALAEGLPWPMVLVCLFLTFMFGPIGWLVFVLLRGARRRRAAAS